ncbi:helix-turn-helix domain-containing protein [Mucilaginibacter jinjuensis]|uniref:Helix-turn-helix transcriptional regulator n=1 Tax=Mucilaginibacter jinjuensis TaxID=1176721 RepID=A0ABY7TC59_9SPHI|nr:helix-turn-helix transcriptional regulator [Mucilaginibacter jinjuensis]WCT13798.1 helix-turn-helix transcriptional regulator [Mucilaginibacter jinjuensis]
MGISAVLHQRREKLELQDSFIPKYLPNITFYLKVNKFVDQYFSQILELGYMTRKQVEFRIKFGLRIKQLREREKLAQNELAAKLGEGKDKQTINRYETQGANPSAYQIVELATALKVDVEEMFDFSTVNPKEVELLVKKDQERRK